MTTKQIRPKLPFKYFTIHSALNKMYKAKKIIEVSRHDLRNIGVLTISTYIKIYNKHPSKMLVKETRANGKIKEIMVAVYEIDFIKIFHSIAYNYYHYKNKTKDERREIKRRRTKEKIRIKKARKKNEAGSNDQLVKAPICISRTGKRPRIKRRF